VVGEATALSQWAGLGRTHPVLALTFTAFLLSFAGIPLTAGFIGKFAVFSAAVAGGAWPLAVVGVLASAAAAFFYVRVIVLMYFTAPAGDSVRVVSPSILTSAAVAIGVAITLVLGVVPAPLLDLASRSALFLR
jgi:NADH-quinone oxidoreductase subunit N